MGSSQLWGVWDHITMTGNAAEFANIGSSESCIAVTVADGPGTGNAVFLEDSTITFNTHNEGVPLMDQENGARSVIRHNTLQNIALGGHGADSGPCGGVLAEFYENSVTYGYYDYGLGCTWNISGGGWRSGALIIYGNFFTFHSSCWNGYTFPLKTYRWPGWGGHYHPRWNYDCTSGNQLKFCSALNTDWSNSFNDMRDCKIDADCTGYGGLCKWKLCSGSSGQGTMILCDESGDCSPDNGDCTYYVDGGSSGSGYPCFTAPSRGVSNTLSPSYAWDNDCTGGQNQCTSASLVFSSEGDLTQNTDYFDCGSSKCAGFSYTAYTYPHPLAGGGGGGVGSIGLGGSGSIGFGGSGTITFKP